MADNLGTTGFNPNLEPNKGITGSLENRRNRLTFNNDVFSQGGLLDKNISELKELLSQLDKISKVKDKINKRDQDSYVKQKVALEQNLAVFKSVKESQNVSATEVAELLKSNSRDLKKSAGETLRLLQKAGEHSKEIGKNLDKSADAINASVNRAKTENDKALLKVAKMKVTSDDALKSIGNSMESFGNKMADISNVLNLDKIASNVAEQGARAKLTIQNEITKQLGITTSGFQSLKGNLNSTLFGMNNTAGSNLYGSQDMLTYLSKLPQLGIVNQSMAQQLMKATIVGNKYLGVSDETQQEIFKLMKRTNNYDMLDKHNQVITALLKSQLGVSKEQLNVISQQAYQGSDILQAVGATPEAIERSKNQNMAVGAALTSVLGESSASSLMSTFNEYLNTTDYAKWAPLLGSNALSIQQTADSGNTGNAMLQFINSLKLNSGNTTTNRFLNELLGLSTQDIATLRSIQSNPSNYNKITSEYNTAMGNINSGAGANYEGYVQETTDITLLQGIQNSLSLMTNGIDWKYSMGLADAAALVLIGSQFIQTISGLKSLFGGRRRIFRS